LVERLGSAYTAAAAHAGTGGRADSTPGRSSMMREEKNVKLG